jgi:L-threonylcarbamoyladenylate synthase
VAFPTETVYGLGANALDAHAVARIFAAKGRPAWNPVIVHVPNREAAQALVAEWPARAERLARACWPGPLTLVLRKSNVVPDVVTAGTDTVAVRVPAHPAALALLREVGVPIAAPSANRFTQLSPTTAQHVADGLGERVSLILDGGPCDVGIESTVLDLTGDAPVILRPGGISADTLSAVLGEPVLSRAVDVDHRLTDAEPQRSPGGATRHYAPRAEVWLTTVEDMPEVQTAVSSLARTAGSRVGALLLEGSVSLDDAGRTLRLPAHPDGYARGLYSALHTLDGDGCTVIVVEAPPIGRAWDAVRDRLSRATH